ncbi:hypothetical protein FQB35_04555 [Crassaminicella thermophila]|uniref:Phage protein n=1 Tax=Crassaminicella thermophila TaxID=2599308 RepID=A0A5C0SBZ6_CRATE|nr:hypothetical protein [Crassaminicella thermophila]QEK11691.1 hypothetical protein FQB35_04555 [Crassaminicella thermophila]
MIEKDILEQTYFNRMKIIRITEIITEWDETISKEITVASNIKCAVSQTRRSSYNAAQTNVANEIKYTPKLFCGPDVDIKVGDKLIITLENGMTREYKTGEPYLYSSHQEIPLLREGEA